MHHARQLLRLALVASIVAPLLWARSSSLTQEASAAAPTPDLTTQRTLIAESNAARTAGDYASARAMAAEVVTYLLARPAAEQDAAWLALLDSAGLTAWYAQDTGTANSAWKRVYEVRLAALPHDHSDVQAARMNLAGTCHTLGDLAGARVLYEQVLEVNSRTLPADHPELQKARRGLAGTLYELGDLAGARVLYEQVLEVNSRTLPDDHLELQAARVGLAATLFTLGDLPGARVLEEKALEVNSRTLPDDSPTLQIARLHLANTLYTLGDLPGARALQEKVLEVFSRTLSDDHPYLQAARQNLAATLCMLGDLAGARALQEQVLEVNSRTLPADHPDLQKARQNLAVTINGLGDLAGSRVLFEQVLEVRSRTLPADHPDLQGVRQNLAITLYTLGDLAGARTLQEQVLEVSSRTRPDDDPNLQAARNNLALTLYTLGDLAGARALDEQVLEVRSRTLPADHRDLQTARQNLAMTIKALGDLAGARALEEQVLEVRSRTLPADHPDLQAARQNLAMTIKALGDLAGARALEEQVLEVRSRTLPADHPDLQKARQNLAITIAWELARSARSPRGEGERTREREAGRERCSELIDALCLAQLHAARAAILASPAREAEERCAGLAKQLDVSLSFAQGKAVFEALHELERPVFVVSETTRGAALGSAELTRRAAHSPRYTELRESLRVASAALAGLAQKGTTSAEFDRARVKRESVERELVALAREYSGGKKSSVEFDVESLAARLAEREAAVGFRRFTSTRVNVVDELDSTGRPAVREVSTDSLCAFVVRSWKSGARAATNAGAKSDSAPSTPLTLVDLGPFEPIEAAARAWREGLGVAEGSRGVAASVRAESASSVYADGVLLREKIFDPLLPLLAGAQRIVVVLDDVLHLVPLDALPLDETTLVGDRWELETRTTLTELLSSSAPFEDPGELVALGDVDYGADAARAEGGDAPASAAVTELAAADVKPGIRELDAPATDATPRGDVEAANGGGVLRPGDRAGILRGSAWERGFSALPGTGVEVRGIATSFAEAFGSDAAVELWEHAAASRKRLLALAPRARYLHIATHGWFAPESIKSWSDTEPIDKRSGFGTRMTGAEQVKGMSPMLLCGLALAGANLPEDAVGRAPGLVTADELSTLDLSNCELAVLSACDTNAGERRAGQGVASLQKALQMAGARSVITSLWKVPDEATKELMLDFYRRLWREKKPKHQALWEAKTKLREAKDERGAPKYTTRDWAAWVLTGDPE